ncbi:MAG TPA: Ig-like domain-containing protein [Thermoleophilaceae bacterium]|nr:Ig-like domain-containing protein [Thermoleophilaceae bacterium]
MERWVPLVITASAALILAAAPAVAGAETISGHVTGPLGEDLQGICVAAHNPADATIPGGVTSFTTTDAGGLYTLTVASGSHKVSFSSSAGCATPPHVIVTEFYDDAPDHASATAVAVPPAGSAAGISAQVAFVPADPTTGTISGTVTNADPVGVPEVCVAALDDAEALVAFAFTDVDGDYAMENLAPGDYRVIFTTDDPCSSSSRIVSEYHQDQAAFEDADIVTVVGGETDDIDATVTVLRSAVDDQITVSEDSISNAGNVLANDVEPDSGDANEVTATTAPLHGSVTIAENGTDVLYTPAADYCGLDLFTYTLNGEADSTANVAVEVTCGADASVAMNDSATVDEDSEENAFAVRANDTDADGGSPELVESVDDTGTDGTVEITGAGTGVSYEPNPDFCGEDTFTYTLTGGSTATVTVTVTCLPDEPVAVDDVATVAEDSGATAIDVRANDTDADGGAPAPVESVIDGTDGSVEIIGGGAGVSYEPNPDFCGEDTFIYTLTGGSAATVTVTVTCVDDGPVAVNDVATVAEDAAATVLNVLANDTDGDGGAKSVGAKTNGTYGAVTVGAGAANVTYKPNSNYCGPDSFTYTVNGGDSATVSVTVTCADDAPTAVNDAKTVAEDSPATVVNVLANDTDADGGAKTVAAKTNGAHGTVAIGAGGANVTYKPAANYCGSDSFTYTLNGGSKATVAMTVTCVAEPDLQAPNTTITDKPKAKIKSKRKRVKVSFSFESSEPGSTFRCKMDDGAFRACDSPKDYTVRRGKHTFTVVATDAAGNTDPTPATSEFKLVKKKKKK